MGEMLMTSKPKCMCLLIHIINFIYSFNNFLKYMPPGLSLAITLLPYEHTRVDFILILLDILLRKALCGKCIQLMSTVIF